MKQKILVFTTLFLLCFGVAKKVAAQCTGYPSGTVLSSGSSPTSLTTTSYTAPVYYLNGDVDIVGDVTFTDAVLVIAANVTITVKPTGNLILAGCHLFACGSSMWNGIVIENTISAPSTNDGTLTTTGTTTHTSTLIEDAKIAVQMNGSSSFYATTGGRVNQLDITNTIFNKNYIGIEMDNYSLGNSTGVPIGLPGMRNPTATIPYPGSPVKIWIYAFSIQNSIFTCRTIPINPATATTLNVWPDLNDFKTSPYWATSSTYPNTPNVMSNPYIDINNYPPTNLKSPYSSEKSDIGININPLFSGTSERCHFVVGEHNRNTTTGDWNTTIFDNQRIGINAYQTHIEICNCTFQNPVFKSTTYDAIGILAVNASYWSYIDVTTPTGTPTNAFFDCQYGIRTENLNDITIKNSDIRNNIEGTLNGEVGIDVESNDIYQLDISANYIFNIGNGIIYRATPSSLAGNAVLPYGDISVYDNVLSSQPSGISTLIDREKNLAIELEIAAPLLTGHSSNFTSAVRCINNNIADYFNGIEVQGFEGEDCRILNNNVTLRDNGLSPQFAIRVEDCYGAHFNYNNSTFGYFSNTTDGNFIFNNTIDCGNGGTSCSGCDRAGIDVFGGYNFTINCNKIYGSTYAMRFNGDLRPNTEVFNNIMYDNNRFGLCLFNAALYGGGGTIGVQGEAHFASDNQWDGSWGSGNYATYCNNSLATNSHLFVRLGSGLPYDPSGSGLNYNFGIGSNAYDISNSSLEYGIANGYDCSTSKISWKNSVSNTHSANSVDEQMALGTMKMPAINQAKERLFVMQLQLYKSLLSSNTAMAAKSGVLKNFVNNPPVGFKNIVDVETALSKANKTKAQQLIANWQPQSIVEANYKQYYSWYVDGKPNLNELYAFAQQCPLINGAVVHYARALYNSLAHKNIVFLNNCDGKFGNENLITEADNKLSLFPNPAKFFTKVSCEGLKQIEVYNSLGNLVNLYKSSTNVYTLTTSSFAKGLYLVKAITIDNKHYTQKIVVE